MAVNALASSSLFRTSGVLCCAALIACGAPPELDAGLDAASDAGRDAAVMPAPPIDGVEVRWLGITTWLIRVDDTVVLIDPYFSDPGLLGPTPGGARDYAQVIAAAGLPAPEAILVGHSHYDHAVDVGPVALASGARVYGSATTCHLAVAEGLDPARCAALTQGDAIDVGPFRVEVIRTVHWSPETNVGAYRELTAPPPEDQFGTVPHGGVLSFLVTASTRAGAFRLFFQDTFGPLDAADGSSEDYAANLAALGAPVDAWITAAHFAESDVELGAYLDVISTRYVVPQHWDGASRDVHDEVGAVFDPPSFFRPALQAAGAEMLVPQRYGQRLVLDEVGLRLAD